MQEDSDLNYFMQIQVTIDLDITVIVRTFYIRVSTTKFGCQWDEAINNRINLFGVLVKHMQKEILH